MGTQDNSSPSRSASGQLTSPANGAGRLTSQIPALGTRPLPTGLLAASGNPGPAPTYGSHPIPSSGASAAYGGGYSGGYAGQSNGAGAGMASPASGYAGYGASAGGDYAGAASNSSATPSSGYRSTGTAASLPTANYGQAPAPSAPHSPMGAATAAYGVQSLSAYGGLPPAGTKPAAAASAYPPAASASAYPASYAPTGGSASPVSRNTQIYGQTLTNWQPALPVSPWSTVERSPSASGNLGTETILKTDLRKLKNSRLKAWFYLFLTLGGAGAAGYYGFGHFQKLVADKNATQAELARLRVVHTEAMAKTSASAAVVGQKPAGAAAAPAVVSAGTSKLAEELKRVLGGSPLVGVETRGDRVVVSVDGAVLFSGRETEVGLGGYRTLYKFGKTLKTVKDRRVAITVPSIEIKRFKAWNLAAARAVSLGRFFTDDLGFERGRVLVATPAPRMPGKIPSKNGVGRVEFMLEPLGG